MKKKKKTNQKNQKTKKWSSRPHKKRKKKKIQKKSASAHGTMASYLRDGGPGKRSMWLKDANLVKSNIF